MKHMTIGEENKRRNRANEVSRSLGVARHDVIRAEAHLDKLKATVHSLETELAQLGYKTNAVITASPLVPLDNGLVPIQSELNLGKPDFPPGVQAVITDWELPAGSAPPVSFVQPDEQVKSAPDKPVKPPHEKTKQRYHKKGRAKKNRNLRRGLMDLVPWTCEVPQPSEETCSTPMPDMMVVRQVFLMDFIKANPGLTQYEIADRLAQLMSALHMPFQSIGPLISTLRIAGIVRYDGFKITNKGRAASLVYAA